GAAARGVSALGGAAAGAGAALAAPAPSASITPTTVLTCTVVPSGTLISFSTPADGAGISASTLSVEISNRGSSRCTFSPGFFSHLVMVPSTMDSPICGITMSVGIVPFRPRASQNLHVRPNDNYRRWRHDTVQSTAHLPLALCIR